jgi:hypothetical protein
MEVGLLEGFGGCCVYFFRVGAEVVFALAGVVFFDGSLITVFAKASNSAMVELSNRVSSPHISQMYNYFIQHLPPYSVP